ncbi:uncharacterized protein LTR77_002438 [Saxophila tyrrhenica]|uniref:Alpha/beta hydrolase fold-3 domain-containing protein n=1 Tax=Saxophila tyrrhenica TaxID=1690608 RepID=A0AAV9PL74_9PEZI|nr:hypothetical protein LTR77_002438 [Saxophila tyrrhenica]
MSDFHHLQGSSKEWLAIQDTLPATVPNPSNLEDILALRDATNTTREQAAATLMQQLGPLVSTQNHSIPTRDNKLLQARTYKSPSLPSSTTSPLYLHLHGGGFLFGTLSSEDAACAHVALDAQVTVLNVCYRHTPEHRYPTAWNDVADALQWVEANLDVLGIDPQRVVVGGTSAGAWLTASTLLTRASYPGALRIVGQVLMIPCLVFHECIGPQLARLKDPGASSYVQNRDAPILPESRMRLFSDLLEVRDPQESDLRLNPGNAEVEDVKHLPPTVFGIAGLDFLRDEGLLYAKLLHEAGIPTNVHVFAGVPHGFRRFGDRLPESARWDQVIVDGIRWALSRPTHSEAFSIDTGR